MKHNKIYLSMAALVLVCAMTAGCSSDDNLAKIEITQPEIDNGNQTAVYTITVNLDEAGGTRALNPTTGVKTFSEDDQIALIYKDNATGQLAKLVSNALTDADIASEGKSATFSFNSTPIPVSDSKVRYIYPASMAATTLPSGDDVNADNDGTVDYSALGTQDGTASSLANVDLGIYDGTASGTVLPTSFTLLNQLTICEFTLKDGGNSNADITSSVNSLTISDGTNAYAVSPSGLDAIYVAMKPASGNIAFTAATTASKTYFKTATSKTLTAGTLYTNITVSMVELAVGSVFCSDGSVYASKDAATSASKTPVALICYLGNDAETNAAFKHGLALALTDASTSAVWCSQKSVTCLGKRYDNWPDAKCDMAGIANTDALIAHGTHTHDAAKAARNYNSGTHPIGTSAWFLPSAGQWDKMITAAGGFVNLKTNAGLQKNCYYSSTETNAMRAWYLNMGSWSDNVKTVYNYVRSALAF